MSDSSCLMSCSAGASLWSQPVRGCSCQCSKLPGGVLESLRHANALRLTIDWTRPAERMHQTAGHPGTRLEAIHQLEGQVSQQSHAASPSGPCSRELLKKISSGTWLCPVAARGGAAGGGGPAAGQRAA